MTTKRLNRRRRCGSLLAAGMLAGVVLVSTAGPAMADPTEPPTPPTVGSSPPASKPGPALFTPPAGSITWAVQPSTANGPDRRPTFMYTNIKPLTIIHDYVGVTNFSAMPVTFQIYATDAYNTSTGALGLLPAAQRPTDIGSWVTFPKTSLTVPAGARINEPFTVQVPTTASPGDHTGGVIAAVSVGTKAKNGAQVTVDRRIAVPLYLRVSGPLHPSVSVQSLSSSFHGTANPFGGGGTNVSYTVRNTGNVRLNLSQAVAITGPFGITLASADTQSLTNLLPGSSLRVTAKLTGVFPAGPLNAAIHVVPTEVAGIPQSADPPRPVSRGSGMWATPWPQILLFVLLVGLAFGVRWFLRWRKQRTQQTIAAAVAKAKKETTAELTGAKAGGRDTGDAGGSG
ncbi:MAG TPA: DUF916 domain-containing protein [Micromonosporaceae bacterium]|nr:DUF916 domain-containing protein [Micromonosporaceae bacterium]